MSEATEKHSRLSPFGRWVAELLLVLIGVYAAFWLNNYQLLPFWDPLRGDPRFEIIVTSLAPNGAKH
jgi:hypothetical protein